MQIIVLLFVIILISVMFYSPSLEGLTSWEKKFRENAKKNFNKAKKVVRNSKIYKATGVDKYLSTDKKKKSKPKPKPKVNMILKPAASADYSDNIKSPYTGDNFKSIQTDLNEYKNALDGKSSKMFVSDAPIGKRYFYNTGVKCTSTTDGTQVDRYSVIDAREGVKNDDGTVDKSMFASAIADLNRSTIFQQKPDYSQTLKDKCKKVTIVPIDVYGKELKAETQYVSVFDVNNFNNTQLGDKTEAFKPAKNSIRTADLHSSWFVTDNDSNHSTGGHRPQSDLNLHRFTTTMNLENMDAGQKAFIYSLSVLGLYFVFKALQK